MQACLTDEMTGGHYKEQHPRARPAPASAEVCGDDGEMEVGEMETSQQQHLILVIQVCAGFSAV